LNSLVLLTDNTATGAAAHSYLNASTGSTRVALLAGIWFQIGNRTRSGPNLKWNHHKVGLDVQRWLVELLRILLRKGHGDQEYAYGDRSAGLKQHSGNLRCAFNPSW
jgi:hypothetical protein